jgi:precorrin-6A synthase
VRKVSIIGVGTGDPEQVTVQAIKALNAADVVFVVTKASEQQDLVDLRTHIVERYVEPPSPRIVEVPDPERRRGASAADHRAAVGEWRAARAEQYERLLREELGVDEHGAFLGWGDPTLYESTLSIVEGLVASGGMEVDVDVVPGVSAVSALAARHRIPLNRVGGAVQITTGRRLADHGLPPGADDVVVMLDPQLSFRALAEDGLEVYWGAYLGMEDELLVSGPLSEVAGEIERVRAEAKERKGWMFDTYLLRRT